MEAAMGGGASFNTDGDWESICRILSIDQDSDFATILAYNHPHCHLPTSYDHEGLLSALMDGTTTHYDPITSPYSQFHSQHSLIPNPYVSPQLMSCSSTTTSNDDLSYNNNDNSSSSGYLNDNPSHFDQISPLLASPSLDYDSPINNGSNAHRVTKKARDDQAPVPKKRPRISKDVEKAKRETQPRKSKVKEVKIQDVKEEEEDDRKSGCNASENDESIASEGLLTQDVNGRKRASRGSATDPQSLYARKRRERINERLKILQTLVPNGTKVDISTMLEEAVNYVNFLQLQIKLLSSDEMWMYAPLAYNGFDVGHSTSFWS